jgi:hypothetical protein
MENLINKIKDEVKAALIEYIEDNCDAIDQEKLTDDMINETSFNNDLPSWYESPAEMMKENDNTMYRETMNNYIDGLLRDNQYILINDELYNSHDVENAQFDFYSELSDELECFINDIEF